MSRRGYILLVEDNPADATIALELLKMHPEVRRVQVARDGADALARLRGEGGDLVRPDLVLLDLRLPKVDGREVLTAARADPALRTLPIVVLSGSDAPEDVEGAYRAGASAYLVKPLDFARLDAMIGALVQFWLVHAELVD